jgi:hypothetical protein
MRLFAFGHPAFGDLQQFTADFLQLIEDPLPDSGYTLFLLRVALAVIYVFAVVGIKLGAGLQKAVYFWRSHILVPFHDVYLYMSARGQKVTLFFRKEGE